MISWDFIVVQIHLVGLQLFTAKKYEDICPSSHKVHVPNIKRIEYQVRRNISLHERYPSEILTSLSFVHYLLLPSFTLTSTIIRHACSCID